MSTRKVIGRDLPNGDYIEIEAEERDDSGILSPGFTVTLTGWEKRGTWSGRAAKRNGREATFAGSAPEVILAVAPELAPLVAAHGADPDGTPMHAQANGWYFYTGDARRYEDERYGPAYAARMGTDHERAAQALHVAPADLPTGLGRDDFAGFVRSLSSRWFSQAQAARAALAAMVDGEGVED